MPARSSATAVQPAHDIRSRRTKRHQSAKSRMHVPIAIGMTSDVIRSGNAARVAAKKQTCPSATTAAQAAETFQTRPGFQIRFTAHADSQKTAPMGDISGRRQVSVSAENPAYSGISRRNCPAPIRAKAPKTSRQ